MSPGPSGPSYAESHPKGRLSGRFGPLWTPIPAFDATRKPDLLPPVWSMGPSEFPGNRKGEKLTEKQARLFYRRFFSFFLCASRTVWPAKLACPGAVTDILASWRKELQQERPPTQVSLLSFLFPKKARFSSLFRGKTVLLVLFDHSHHGS